MTDHNETNLTVVSLFTGAMGLDLGLELAGFRTVVAVESDPDAASTIRANRPNVHVIERDIGEVPTTEILEAGGLKLGEPTLLAGGPACQTFSTAGRRRSLGSATGLLLYEFIRVVQEMQPEFFVMENVRGLLSAAVEHRPLNQRGPGHPPLREEEELGSAFRVVADRLRELDYYVVFDILNAADFGAPQTRQRLVMLGSRDHRPLTMPHASHSGDGGGNRPAWATLREAVAGLNGHDGEGLQFVPSRRQYLRHVPPGGNWRDLPEELKADALGGAHRSWGGRTGFLRRLAWDRPSPTLNTDPDQKATSLCHPDEVRPLSVPEYARIQGFPDDWKVEGGMGSKYRQLGNAVPVKLGTALGWAVRTAKSKRRDGGLRGRVECHNLALLDSLVARQRTRLNPPRMRDDPGSGKVAEWAGGQPRIRDDATAYVPPHLVGAVGRAKVAASVVKRLRDRYGSPDLGNYSDPVDELFFILLSRRTTGPSYERVFRRLKEWVGEWESLPRRRVWKVIEMVAPAGLGAQRAEQMVETARRLRKDFGRVTLDPLMGEPDVVVKAYLTSLPGVGVKTAKCVMMFSMGRQVLPVDAHVARVGKRLGLVDSSASGARTHEVLEAVVPPADRFDFHVNAIAHGRTACRARNPVCKGCPVRHRCVYVGAPEARDTSTTTTSVSTLKDLTHGEPTTTGTSGAKSARSAAQSAA